MKASIIIPAYNEEKHIEAAIKAALAQDHDGFDYEVIVVDNVSTDRTSEVAKKFPVKVLYEGRLGTQWARECGRQAAAGEIIANLDSDCLPDRDWLSKGLAHFTDQRVVAVSGPYDYYDASTSFRAVSLFSQKYIYATINVLAQFLRRGAVVIGGNILLRASALEKAGGYDTAFTFYGDDPDTGQRMMRQGKVVFDKNLVVKTSARRFKNQGTFKIVSLYFFYFFKILFQPDKKTN